MRVRWQQIDPRVAAKAGTRLRSVAHQTEAPQVVAAVSTVEASSDSAAAVDVAAVAAAATPPVLAQTKPEERLHPIWSVFSLFTAALIVALYGAVCFASLTGPLAVFLLTLLPVGCVATMAASIPSPSRPAAVGSLKGVLPRPSEQLRHALVPSSAEGETSRAERLYGEVIYLLVSDAATVRGQQARRAQALLKECNTLLATYYQVERETQRVRALLAQETARPYEDSERFRLSARFASETDPIARRSLRESLELCEERWESVQSLGPLLARLEAHQEVICQALALAQAALAREQAAPAALHAPDVSLLRQTVRGITQRTRAMEEAMTEMTDLNS